MLKNYFKIAARNLLRNKGFSVINILGLAIGMACTALILLWIQNEASYDGFHPNLGRLYEVGGNDTVSGKVQTGLVTQEVLGPAIQKEYPEIENTARIGFPSTVLVAYQDKAVKVQDCPADPSFLTLFGFPLIAGDVRTALKDPHSLVITRKTAKKLFGDSDPIGKVVKWDNALNFTITGVLKDLPDNTQFDFEALNSYAFKELMKYVDMNWDDYSVQTFVLLKPNTDINEINRKIAKVSGEHSGGKVKTTDFLYPVSRLRLYSKFENGRPAGGRITTIRTFFIIAAFILLIACINFMNLSSAKSEDRAREVGIRKAMGALRGSPIRQFIGESVLIAFLSGLLALALVEIALPGFRQLTGKQLFIDYRSAYFWLGAPAFVLLTGILAGSYPAFFLSGFRPEAVLKGAFTKAGSAITPRKVLVVLQFSVAIVLIVCTIIIERQIQYALHRNTGYDKDQLVYVPVEGDIPKNYAVIKNESVNSGAATAVNVTQAPLTQIWSYGTEVKWQGKDPNAQIGFIRTASDEGLVQMAGLQLVEGRDIDIYKYPSDSTACVINEAAAKVIGLKNIIGQTIYDEPTNWHVVGVIKDFVLNSPYQAIDPLIIYGPQFGGNVMNIRLNGSQSDARNLGKVAEILKKYNPAYPFEYHFLSEEYAKKFEDEQLTGRLAALFAGLAICISCLGLLSRCL
jgi:putative ABC transport system permease protein